MSSDPLGYYADLGVSPSASLEEIRAVYRALAKIYHPDVNRDRAAAEKFRRVTKAYEIVGNSERRSTYDLTAKDSKLENPYSDAPVRRKAVEAIKCSLCRKVTAQPRFLVFRQVVSFIIITQTSPKPGIFCCECASRQAFRSSAISALFGWWGFPWGPINTIREIVRNAFGGERRIEVDEQLIWQNAVAFMDGGKFDLAGSLARQLKSAKDADIALGARHLLDLLAISSLPIGQLKSPWKLSPVSVLSQLTMGASIPAVAYFLLVYPSGGVDRSGYLGASPPLQSKLSEQSASAPAVITPVNLCRKRPKNGQVLQKNTRLVENGHRLTIINGSSGDAIAKLRVGQDKTLAASFYVKQNATASFDHIPDGAYTVQFAYGQAMTKDCISFVEKIASEFEGVKILQTDVTSTQIITQELSFTLYTVAGGNAHPFGISPSDFDAP